MPDLTFADVGQILRLLESIDASDVDLEWGDLRLRVRHGQPVASADGDVVPQPEAAPATAESVTPATIEPGTSSNSTSEPRPDSEAADATAVPDHWVAIGAPMVGTFYRSPKPEEPAYVAVGDVVAAGDTVGLVEVMKLFTELKCDVAGKVARVDAEDAALVEFGEPLIWIEPA